MKALLLAAIGVTMVLLVMRERPESEPPKPAPVAKTAPAPVVKTAPAPVVKTAPAPARPPLVVKQVEAPPKVAEEPKLIPVVAAAAPAPAIERPTTARPPEPEPDPNSVYGWGPWSGGSPQPGGADARGAPQEAIARAQSALQSVSFTQPGEPGAAALSPNAPVSLPPVTLPPIIKNGHGWGDRNHEHRHRHFDDLRRGRD